ncbi:MAG: serine protease [Trueperaceae bacterium]|nr:serine protease [Trueperaceae bacterium]
MIDPWSHEGAAQAAHTRVRRTRLRPLTFVLLALLVGVAWPFMREPRPQYLQVNEGPPAVVGPTGVLSVAYELARPATLRIEVRCSGVFARQVLGLGSGFFFDANGLVLTAYHVVDGPSGGCPEVRYVGVGPDRTEYPLELVGFDAYMDLAVLRATVDVLVPFIPLGSRLPRPGTDVVAIGNSRGDFLAGRAGTVTRLGVRAARVEFAEDTIELTAALAPGDSGGPVVTARGEAVGVVSYISFNPSRMESAIPPFLLGVPLPRNFASYAVPVEEGSLLVADLVAGGRRDVPVIGFSWDAGYDYDPARADVDLGPRPGPIVWRVAPGGPAEAAGLRSLVSRPIVDADDRRVGSELEADVIVAIDGIATPTFADLLAQVRMKQIGQTIAVSVQRGAATFRLDLVLGARRNVFAGR